MKENTRANEEEQKRVHQEEPDPEYLDVVPAPDGYQCTLWGSGGTPEPCQNRAEYLFVYDSALDNDRHKPQNAVACSECFSVPTELIDRFNELVGQDG